MQPDVEHGAEPNSELVRITDLEVSFSDEHGAHPVLRGIELSIAAGERVAIVGESGSGKSTTAASILDLLPGTGQVTAGSIEFRGEDITHASERRMRELRGRQIGLVPQDPMSNLNPVARVGHQITEALITHRVTTRSQAKDRAVELMSEVGIPEPERRFRQYPHEFSGGMRQRVLIAIALACGPELLIADEPTSALDVTVQRQILDHLEKLRSSRGTALLFITHDLGLAADRADRIVVMSQGKVVESGRPDDILRRPAEEYTKRLVAAVPSVAVTRARAGEDSSPVLVEPRPDADGGEAPILTVNNLVKDYRVRGGRNRTFRAVDDVSFSIAPGTTMALVGESGSGKTTVARMVLGLETPTSGDVRLGDDAVAVAKGARRRAIRRAMQPVFQDPYASLNPMFTIEHIVDEPLRVFGMGSRESRRDRVVELLDQVALPRTVAQRHPGELSGGQRQRVAIARALALEPRLVICDEAVSALDVLVQDQILQLLVGLQRDLGLSYLFITHDLAVVRLVAQDVMVMRTGEVVEAGSVDQVFAEPGSEYTQALLDAIPGVGFLQ